ncbi:heat shock protein chaperone [Trichinella spiralis]|uniref:heat shock protein chaperone n=1 Tax=Trichinella spiralis TaxID=6334 RepID=UPI0001EFE3C1|nr:heat shock protein chaperone [Trichinella spiralis]
MSKIELCKTLESLHNNAIYQANQNTLQFHQSSKTFIFCKYEVIFTHALYNGPYNMDKFPLFKSNFMAQAGSNVRPYIRGSRSIFVDQAIVPSESVNNERYTFAN